MKAFLTCSFAESDRETIEWFRDLLGECGLQVVWAEPAEAGQTIPGKIYPKIDACELIVGVMTKRHKVEGKAAWTVPPSVLYELGYAAKGGKIIAGFIEKGIPRTELGVLALEGLDIPEFDRDRLEDHHQRFRAYLERLFKRSQITGHYKFLEYSKDVTIYRNGYADISNHCEVQCLNESFHTIRHAFEGGESAKKDWTIPSFGVLRENPVAGRWEQEPFFIFRVTDARFDKSQLQVQSLRSSSKKRVEFQVKCMANLKPAEVFVYEWAWGAHDLFPTTKQDLEPGKREADLEFAESSFEPTAKVDSFTLTLRFEEPASFEVPPYLQIYDMGGNVSALGADFDVRKLALYTTFVARLSLVDLPGGSIRARWIPR